MKKTILLLIATCILKSLFAQDAPSTTPLSALGAYNFGGGTTGLSTPTAQVSYGFTFPIIKIKDKERLNIEFRPGISTAVNATLSSNYLPAIMLPGNASVSLNINVPFGDYLIWNPVNAGLKFLGGFSDSSKTIIQHNLRTALTLKVDNLFMLTAQYTWAWHNSTDDSQRSFNYVFNKYNGNRDATNLEYLTLTFQGRVSQVDAKLPTYLIVQWRSLSNAGQFTTLPNYRIFTIGIETSLDKAVATAADTK